MYHNKRPIDLRYLGLKNQASSNIKNMLMLSFPNRILLWRFNATSLMNDSKTVVQIMISKFISITRSYDFDFDSKLIMYQVNEIGQN